ncbi:MAG: ArsB/NhaD family transporter [Planctomycetes bacterium]|nr:ArsB/NhaD family transporter [Planctomycetota bacterium]
MTPLLADQTHEPASLMIMVLFVVIMLLTYLGVAHEKLHKTVAALLGASVLVLLAVVLSVIEYPSIYKILAKDLNVFGVIVGTGILVDVTGRSGLFHFLSMLIVRATGGRATYLFLAVCGLTFVFVALLTIVPAMLILCSLVLVMCRSLDYDPKPFLLSVAICANSGAIVTFASGLPNIMIGTAAEIPYVHFLMVSAPYALVSVVIAVAILRLAFRNDLPWHQDSEELTRLQAKISEFDPWALVEDRWVLARSAIILGLTILGFAFAQTLGLGMDFIAMAGGTAALLFAGHSVEETIGKVNWTVILFFTGLFVIIGCVEATGVLERLAAMVVSLAGDSQTTLIPVVCVFSAGTSAIVDNIPVAATLIPIIENIKSMGVAEEPLWWSLILGSNLGGNGTPIGSISCVIALYALKREAKISVGWGEFIKLGGTIMLVQVVGAVLYVLLLQTLDAIPSLPEVPVHG